MFLRKRAAKNIRNLLAVDMWNTVLTSYGSLLGFQCLIGLFWRERLALVVPFWAALGGFILKHCSDEGTNW